MWAWTTGGLALEKEARLTSHSSAGLLALASPVSSRGSRLPTFQNASGMLVSALKTTDELRWCNNDPKANGAPGGWYSVCVFGGGRGDCNLAPS